MVVFYRFILKQKNQRMNNTDCLFFIFHYILFLILSLVVCIKNVTGQWFILTNISQYKQFLLVLSCTHTLMEEVLFCVVRKAWAVCGERVVPDWSEWETAVAVLAHPL